MKRFTPILICLLLHLTTVAASEDHASSMLSVNFRPEVQMTRQSSAVHLKIRLSESGSAQIWLADNCSAKPQNPTAGYPVTQSGEFEIPIGNLPGNGSRVCLESTDRLQAEASSGQPPAPSDGTSKQQ